MALELSNRKISCTWKIDHCILCSSIELFQVFFGSWHGPNTYMPTYCLFFQNKNYKMVNPLEKSVVATCPWLYTGHTVSKLSIRFNSMNQHFWVQNIEIYLSIIMKMPHCQFILHPELLPDSKQPFLDHEKYEIMFKIVVDTRWFSREMAYFIIFIKYYFNILGQKVLVH